MSADRPPSPKQRVVIYRLGSLGDTIVALPCFNAIAKMFPQAERTVLTNFPVASVAAPLQAVLGSNGIVADFVSYPVRTRSPRALWSLRKQLRSLSADTLIYLTASRGMAAAWRDLIFFRMCGFSRIIGVPLTSDLQQNRIDPASGLVEPECERLARCLAPRIAVDLRDPAAWDLALDADEVLAGEAVAKRFGDVPFIAIHSGGKGAAKDWGERNWTALMASLADSHGDHGLMLLGAQDDAVRYASVAAGWPGPVVDACGVLTPRQLAAAVRSARLFVGHDSGPMHLASISGIPCVGLFGSMNKPRKWHPYVGTTRVIHRVDGIAHIGVAEVVDAVRAMMGGSRVA